MIVAGLLTVAPVFGPLGKTLHYLGDFIAERPQPMGAPDLVFRRAAGSDHLSCRAAPVCHIAGFIYPKWHANRAARMIATSAPNQSMKPAAPDRISVSHLATDPARGLSLSR
jgi:hypothetical protein